MRRSTLLTGGFFGTNQAKAANMQPQRPGHQQYRRPSYNDPSLFGVRLSPPIEGAVLLHTEADPVHHRHVYVIQVAPVTQMPSSIFSTASPSTMSAAPAQRTPHQIRRDYDELYDFDRALRRLFMREAPHFVIPLVELVGRDIHLSIGPAFNARANEIREYLSNMCYLPRWALNDELVRGFFGMWPVDMASIGVNSIEETERRLSNDLGPSTMSLEADMLAEWEQRGKDILQGSDTSSLSSDRDMVTARTTQESSPEDGARDLVDRARRLQPLHTQPMPDVQFRSVAQDRMPALKQNNSVKAVLYNAGTKLLRRRLSATANRSSDTLQIQPGVRRGHLSINTSLTYSKDIDSSSPQSSKSTRQPMSPTSPSATNRISSSQLRKARSSMALIKSSTVPTPKPLALQLTSVPMHLSSSAPEPKSVEPTRTSFYPEHLPLSPLSVTSLVDRPSTAPHPGTQGTTAISACVIIRVVVDASHHFSVSVRPQSATLRHLEDRVVQKWQHVGGKLGDLEGRMFVGKNERGDVWRVRSDQDLQHALQKAMDQQQQQQHATQAMPKLSLYWV